MKTLLLQDIPKLGQKGEVKETSDGYARNFLIPRGLAETATPWAIRRLEETSKIAAERKKDEVSRFQATLDKLSGKSIEIELPANEKGEFYQKVTAKIIAGYLKNYGITEEDIVSDDKSIKQAGEYSIPIRRNNTTGNILFKISAKND